MGSSGCVIETRPLTAEEEALRKNTDCVYYLASPLTCKKGNGCEYRHSETARLNPRDCWYWLNSNCLNPKCAFRHPPLDGLLAGKTSGMTPMPLQTATSKPIPTANDPPYSLNKQTASCIYFQKGQCLKGERCPFSHGPPANGTALQQPAVKTSPPLPHQLQAFKDQVSTQQSISQESMRRSIEAPVASAKPTARAESYGIISHTSNPMINNALPRSHSVYTPPVTSNNVCHQIHPSDDHLQNGLEPGEIVEECSLGFDARGADHNGYNYRRSSTKIERKHEPVNGYKHQPYNHKSAPAYGRTQSGASVDEFVQDGHTRDYHDARKRRISSERSLERTVLPERRLSQRMKSPDVSDSDDLRNRLKQRRLDGSKDRHGEPHESRRGSVSRRDQMPVPVEASLSSRLRGRISLPVNPADSLRFSEKDRDVSRLRGRLSPPGSISKEVGQFDRARKSSEEPPLLARTKNFTNMSARREDGENFSGPKSLAELKGAKGAREQPTKSTSTGIPKDNNNVAVGKAASREDTEVPPVFEGPKPLSFLLKRKREEVLSEGANSSSVGEDRQRSEEPAVYGPVSSGPAEEQASSVADNNEESVDADAASGGQEAETAQEDELTYDEGSLVKEDAEGAEGYMEINGAFDEQELQHSDVRDGELDYKATETGDYDGEYGSQGEEEEEADDDEDDFARKLGLIFS